MKKFMKALSLVLALGLILGLTVTASAETVKVSAGSAMEIEQIILNAAGKDVEITLVADIDDYLYVWTEEDQTVTLKGDVALANIEAGGSGTVVVDVAKIEAKNGEIAILASETATIKVNADVTSKGVVGGGYDLVETYDDSVVEITGNVTAGSTTGDDTGAADAIYAEDNSSVTVIGNVKGGDGIAQNPAHAYADGGSGIAACENAKVKVTGNVTAGASSGFYAYAAKAIHVSDNANVEVIGNVYGGTATETNGYDYTGDQLWAGGHAIVVEAYNDNQTPSVKVIGDVFGGNPKDDDSLGGAGIVAFDDYASGLKANITVLGDVTGYGIYPGIWTPASASYMFYVDGTVTGGEESVALYIEDTNGPSQMPDLSQFPTYEEVKQMSPNTTYEEYMEVMFRILSMLGQQGIIEEEDIVPFLLSIYRPVFRLVNVTLPDPFDMNNPDHAAAFQAGMQKIQDELNNDNTFEDKIIEEVQKEDANVYKAFMDLIHSLNANIDPELIPQIYVWALAENEDGDLTNRPGYLSHVKYLIHVNDPVGGTLETTKGYSTAVAMDVVVATPDADYDLESVSANKGTLTGGKVAWNYMAPMDDYTGGIVVTASFKQVVFAEGPSIDGSTGETNPPTSDSDTIVFAALASLTALMGFCMINLVRIRRNEQ